MGTQLAVPDNAPMALAPNGDVYVYGAGRIYRVNASSGLMDQANGQAAGCTPTFAAQPASTGCYPDVRAMAVSPDGAFLYLAENSFVRRIEIATGTLTLVAGTPASPGFSGDGGLAVNAQVAASVIAVEPSGDVLIDAFCRIRRFTLGGNINTIAGDGASTHSGDGGAALAAGGVCASAMVRDAAGNLWVNTVNRVRRIDGSNNISTFIGNGFAGPTAHGAIGPGTTISPSGIGILGGTVVVSESVSQRLLGLDLPGNAFTLVSGALNTAGFAGDGSPIANGRFSGPSRLASAGTRLALLDNNNRRIRLLDSGTGLIQTAVGNGTTDVSGDLTAATLARLSFPNRVARDSAGNIFISDSQHRVVRRVDAVTGVISTYAGRGDAVVASDGDGGPAVSARLQSPAGLAIDHLGGLLIVESSTANIAVRTPSVRRVDPVTGIISTVAGGGPTGPLGDGGPATSAIFNQPLDVVADATGNIYVSDFSGRRIRRFTVGGTITTVAGTGSVCGGPPAEGALAASACVDGPMGLALDSANNLYFVQPSRHIITKLTVATGLLNRFAGTTLGNSGDGGPAVSARMNNPYDLDFDSAGNAFISDNQNSSLRRVDTTGNIATVATSTGFVQGLVTLAGGDIIGAVPVESRVFRYTPAVVCVYSVSPNPVSAPTLGGVASVTVVTPPGCPINAPSTSTPWISNIQVFGNTVSFTAASNAGGSFRSGSILIMGQTLTVNQSTPFTVNVGTSPPGRSFMVDGLAYSSAQAFSFEPGSVHTLEAAPTIQPLGADSQAAFTDWENLSTNPVRSITVNNSFSATAFFRTQHRVTCSVNPPGAGAVTPVCGGFFDTGVTNFTAVPNSGYAFDNFSGHLTGTTNPGALNVTAPRTFTANFSLITVTHQIVTVPAGLPVSVDGGAFQATPRTVAWAPGSAHSITVNATEAGSPGTRFRFLNWTGGPVTTTLNVASAPATATTYMANFQRQFALTLLTVGPGTVSPAGGATFHDEGTTVAVDATPTPPAVFIQWSGDFNSAIPGVNVLMNAPKQSTASFGVPVFTVTLSGAGTLVSNPPGLVNCIGSSCQLPAQLTPVTLTAVPNPGFTAGPWTGCPTPALGADCVVPANSSGAASISFLPAGGGTPNLTAARVGALSGTLANRTWPIRISNAGTGAAANTMATVLGVAHFSGPACVPVLVPAPPSLLGSISPGGNASFSVALDLSDCTNANSRLSLTVQIDAGAYTVVRTLTNLTR